MRDATTLSTEIPEMRAQEWNAWKRRLAWSRGHRRPPRFTTDRAGDLFWGGDSAPEVPSFEEAREEPGDET